MYLKSVSLIVTWLIFGLTPLLHAENGPRQTYDVVVYGGTSAGVTAAIQTAKMGKSVVIIEPGKHVGGLTTSGLGWTDSGNKVFGHGETEVVLRIRNEG